MEPLDVGLGDRVPKMEAVFDTEALPVAEGSTVRVTVSVAVELAVGEGVVTPVVLTLGQELMEASAEKLCAPVMVRCGVRVPVPVRLCSTLGESEGVAVAEEEPDTVAEGVLEGVKVATALAEGAVERVLGADTVADGVSVPVWDCDEEADTESVSAKIIEGEAEDVAEEEAGAVSVSDTVELTL